VFARALSGDCDAARNWQCVCVPVIRDFVSARLFWPNYLFFDSLAKTVLVYTSANSLTFECVLVGAKGSGLLRRSGGESGPPGTLPISSQSFLPRRPSFSLELFDRFAQNNEIMDPSILCPIDHSIFMDIDIEAADTIPGIPSTVDDAIVLSVASLSSRSGVTTSRDPETFVTTKKNKRESAGDSSSASVASYSSNPSHTIPRREMPAGLANCLLPHLPLLLPLLPTVTTARIILRS